MNLRIVALAAAVLPLFAMHAVFLISAGAGQIEWCMPYWDGCTSISRAGRQVPSIYLYRGLMMPAAACMAVYWVLTRSWLSALGDANVRALKALMWMGVLAAVCLVLYASLLGDIGETWRIPRRICAGLFFGLTLFCQVLLTVRLRRLAGAGGAAGLAGWIRVKTVLCVLLVALAVVKFAAPPFIEDDELEDAIEWNFVLLMLLFFLTSHVAWRRSGFHAGCARTDG